ncbi:ferrochelatase [Campylobacter mucosalis]|uniref:ferrochelatase n=1 Tax=Campylobacter mucosalis TaxID=202 RepID=UPI00147001BF|nr:ferrochelatase [Campylobacter mucosalis]
MLIIDLVRLLKGELANRPAISQIYGFSFEAKRIKQGFAFIATQADEDEIATAIKNGAYAIVYDEQVSIIDTEIAYIKVENLRSSLFRLMRYLASQKNIRFFYVNPMQMAMLERLNLGKNATLMSENIDELFDKILRANSNECFFGSHTRTLERISPFYDQVFSDTKITPINPSSIFFSSFICDEIFYQNLNIPRVFLPAFCGLLKFLNKNEISFRVNETKNLGHFEPIFIDKNFRPTNFGSSFRAIITESDEELFYVESAFLQKNFSADEIIFCLPKDTNIKLENAFYFESLNELKELKNFRYALVLTHKSELLSILNEGEKDLGLFD